MDLRFPVPVSREDLYNLQMELKQVQYTQSNHAERLLRLEKRQTDDAALKSVWNSPFPGVLAGTPQHGPVPLPQNDVFDDLDEQGEQLLGSLHLGPAEEEPVRRGAASRANSVRFDESALHGSSWGGQNNRHSGEFAPPRPSSGLMMERSLSHKSDGRHSSAGHSVHSHHSIASGRASSFGMETNYPGVDDDDDSSFEIPGPPVSLYVLGSVPSIVRCWLTTNYAHGTLLYADICSGAQKSTVEYSLVKELDLLDEIMRDVDGVGRIRLNVYFAEAVVTRHSSRSGTPEGSVPAMTVLFEVSGMELAASDRRAIRIFIGSDALRAHSADILFSQNSMTLYGNERDRLRVPFVRPEDDGIFRHLSTANQVPEKPKLNANAAPFVAFEPSQDHAEIAPEKSPISHQEDSDSQEPSSPVAAPPESAKAAATGSTLDLGEEAEKNGRDANEPDASGKEGSIASDASRRGSTAGIWGSWRHGPGGSQEGPPQAGPLSGYQPASRGGRNMKVLKPQKSGSTSARTGASYEPPPPHKSGAESRRKSQASASGESSVNGGSRWDNRRVASTSEIKLPLQNTRETRNAPSLPRAANPVGVASAFSWMTPASKKPSTTAAD
ncbi:ubiquitin carboxyl-terminal hydrolase 19 [Stachybotrys elegans]|uniref:Ubiquitin carboxyl-terminal hydrolase 19 n=1 Tax=Stachybotrys elegans TaxID=80388 RepID=A0A8K0WWT0_9HYPO|nr:ubiquitin carboxyl-terminal hydrolase 19 [Stachybotrys elegans]